MTDNQLLNKNIKITISSQYPRLGTISFENSFRKRLLLVFHKNSVLASSELLKKP